MHVLAALVANAGQSDNGLLHLSGAGWSHCTVEQFPATVQGTFACVVRIDPDDEEVIVELVVMDPSGTRTPMGSAVLSDTMQAALVVPFSFVARHPGAHVIALIAPDGPLADVEFDVRTFGTE